MEKQRQCPSCQGHTTTFKVEHIYPQLSLFRKILILGTILIWGGFLIWYAFTVFTDPKPALIVLLIFSFLALLDIVREKPGDPIETVYHHTCNSCGHQWDITGLEERNQKNS